MRTKVEKWSLEELADFEVALAEWDGESKKGAREEGSRAAVMKAWLEASESRGPGARWVASVGVAGTLLALFSAAIGAGAAWGTLDRALGGVHVIWFLGACLVLPWLLLVLGVIGWLLRGRVKRSGLPGWAVERLSVKLTDPSVRGLVERVKGGGELAKVTGWRLAAISQGIAAAFHTGALLGLGAMVLFKSVGFFWETTTERAMEDFLHEAVRILALPWSWVEGWGLPEVAASRRGPDWTGGGESWWPFLMMSLLVWGVLPRLLFVAWAKWKERRALATLTFQAPDHRKLWRALTTVKRGVEPSGPVDGALVIVLGGAEPDRTELRPFLLNRLRLNPTGWESLGVLDEGREEAAREALEKATAGIVIVAEGWSLAPRQVARALDEAVGKADGRRVVLLVVDPDAEGRPHEVKAVEREEWERFMDTRKGEVAELVFYEEL